VVVEDKQLLDVGCGRGGPSSYIVRYLQPREVIGLDACEDAIRFCQERHRRDGLRFVLGNAEQVPFANQSFDIILNVESSHCYLDRPRFFGEVARLLKPVGLFCYADIFNPNEFENVKHTLSQIKEFRLLKLIDITPEVIRAIDRNRERLTGILTAAIDPRLGNEAIIHNLIHSIQIYGNNVSRQWLYYSWLMEKTVA
jgi:O-methyltransferase